MKKQLQKKYGVFIALLSVFVLTFLGLGACMNPLQSPAERGPDGSTGIRLSIAAGEARTLLPAAGFSKYVVSCSNPGDLNYKSETLTNTTNIVISLYPAVWTIRVTAYTNFEGAEVAAAEGSAQVSLAAGDLKGVSIRVSSILDGAEGYFSYNVGYPEDVSSGYLYVYGSGENAVINKELCSEPSGDKLPLSPGYYRLRIDLDTSYGVVRRSEIVHIYSGMETRGDYNFTRDDFGSPITISGTVDLSGLGTADERITEMEIRLYRDGNTNWETRFSEDFYESEAPNTWNWTARTLPFNQPTDFYLELRINFSGRTLIKRLEDPFSVYDRDLSAPSLGPFTVNRFDLSGLVDFSVLDSLGLTYEYASVSVYQDDSVPVSVGSTTVNIADGSWSYRLMTAETVVPVRIVLSVRSQHTSAGYLYISDVIETSLSAGRSDLDFRPAPVSAETVYTGVNAAGSGSRWYLFVPDASGEYIFKLNSGVSLSLYDAGGNRVYNTSGNSGVELPYSLNAETPYYIELYLANSYQAFQFQVNPVSKANLGGTVDFSGLLSPFSGGVTVSSANIAVYADSSFHTLLGTAAVNGGSWSAELNLDGPSVPAVFVITADLSNGQTICHQESRVISGSMSGLAFSPAAVTGESPLTRTTFNVDANNYRYDYLLYVPAATGDYSLTVSEGSVSLWDAQTGAHLGSAYSNSGGVELIHRLNAGNPYRITVSSTNLSFTTYQFQAKKLQTVDLSGTVDISGLAPHITADDISSTEIKVYTGTLNHALLGSSTIERDSPWSMSVPASETQAVWIRADINLTNGRVITAQIERTVNGNTGGLTLAPAAVSGGPVARFGSGGFLLVPSESGLFNLEVLGVITPNSPYGHLYLYDVAGGLLAQNNNGSLSAASLIAGIPYIVRVDNIGNFAAYQFRMTAVPSISIGGSVDLSGLPSSIRDAVSSAKVSGYVDNPAHTPIVSEALVGPDGSWSALVPVEYTGQTAQLTLNLTLNLPNGDRRIYSHIQTVLTDLASDLDFSPQAVPSGEWDDRIGIADEYYYVDRLLWIPENSGEYTLDAEKAEGGSDLNYMYLYDGLTGDHIAQTYGENGNFRIQRSDFAADHPYIVVVVVYSGGTGDYRFKAAFGRSISLDQTGNYTFPGAATGYGAQNPLTVTVSNAGNQATGALTIERSGDYYYDFTVSPASLPSIEVGESGNFTVVPVQGLGEGTYTATITVSGGTGISASFNVSFTVGAANYSISMDPTGPYTFPGAAVGYGGLTAKSVTVSNTGNQATGELSITKSGTNAGSFTVSPASLSSIAVEGSDSFTVVPVQGLTEGTYTTTITVSNSGNGISASFDVSFAVTTAPTYGISLSETAYTFPGAAAGYGAQSSRTVTVSNTGNQPTGALSITKTGTGAGSFTVSSTSLSSIAVSGSDTFTVTPVTGLAAGTYSAVITVSNSGNGISASFNVNFTVTAAPSYGISLSETGTYTFPGATAGYGTPPTRTVTVSNTGNQETGTLNIGKSGTNAGSFTVSPTSLPSIAANGGPGSFTVAPVPGLSVGTYTATITVSNSGNGISASFNVSFTVTTAPSYGISLSETGTYTFTPAITGYGTQNPRTVTVSNTGNQATGSLTIGKSGTNAVSYTLSKTSIANIITGGSDSFTVVPNTGLAAGTYTAVIVVSGGNGILETFNVSFTVTAPGAVSISVGFNRGDITINGSNGINLIRKTGTPQSLVLSADGYTGVVWYVDGDISVPKTGNTLTISASAYTAQIHSVTFTGRKNGVLFSQVIPFTVLD